MKLKYLLAGMLLLTPLASQAFKGKGMAVVPPARPPVPCKGQGCVKEAPNSGTSQFQQGRSKTNLRKSGSLSNCWRNRSIRNMAKNCRKL